MQKTNRRNVLKTVGATGALLAGGVGTAAAREGKREGASGDDTIVDVAKAADGFDVLVAAVTEAGLVETLSGNRQLTVLAPTDDAFNAAGITVDNVGEKNKQFLVNVLTYHVTPGRRYAKSIVNASQLPTLNGESVAVDGKTLNDGQANIAATDIGASNGVVHVINGNNVDGAGVLLP